jgi:hypothetical protein
LVGVKILNFKKQLVEVQIIIIVSLFTMFLLYIYFGTSKCRMIAAKAVNEAARAMYNWQGFTT